MRARRSGEPGVRGRRWRTPVVLAVVCAVLAGLGAGGWWWSARRGGGEPPGRWRYTAVDALTVRGPGADRFNPQELVGGDGLLVAAGNVREPAQHGYDLHSWYSEDGATWHTGNLGEVSRGAGWYAELSDLARWGDGFVAVGARTDSTTAVPVLLGAAAWTSADGRTWRGIDPPPDPPDGSAFAKPVLYADGGSVYASTGGSSLWRLAPGATAWREWPLHLPEGCSLSGAADNSGTGMVAFGGCPGGAGGAARGAVFRIGADGRARELTGTAPSGLLAPLSSVVVHDRTLLVSGLEADAPGAGPGAASTGPSSSPGRDGPAGGPADGDPEYGGEDAGGRAVVLRSTDGGAHWSPGTVLPLPEGALPGSGGALHLMRVDGTYVAAGQLVRSARIVPAVWTSPDGLRWTVHRLPSFAAEDGHLDRGAALGDRVVIPARYGYGPGSTAGLVTGHPLPGTADER